MTPIFVYVSRASTEEAKRVGAALVEQRLVAFPVHAGNPDHVAWIEAETAGAKP